MLNIIVLILFATLLVIVSIISKSGNAAGYFVLLCWAGLAASLFFGYVEFLSLTAIIVVAAVFFDKNLQLKALFKRRK